MRFTRSQMHTVNLNRHLPPDVENSQPSISVESPLSHSQPTTTTNNTNTPANRRLQRERRRLFIDASGALAIDKADLPQKRTRTKPSRSLSDSLPSVSAATRMKIGIRKQRSLNHLRSARQSILHLQNSDVSSPQSAAANSDDSQATIIVDSLPPLPSSNEPSSTTEHITNEHTEIFSLPPEYDTLPHLWTSIPHSAEKEWEHICSKLLQHICDAEDDETLYHCILQFLLLPRRVLNRVPNQRNAASKLKQQMFRFSYQHQAQDTAQQQPSSSNKDERDQRAKAISKATTLIKAGHKMRAVNTLLQDAQVRELTNEVTEQLKSLHPPASAPLPPVDDLWKKIFLKEQDVARFSRRFFDKGAAPRPSGWTGAMIVPLLDNQVCRRGLAIVFTHIINGTIPEGTLKETLRAARLIPLSKPTNGVRPIAIGEIFTRLAANISLQKVSLKSIFPTIQFGLGKSAGVESAVLTAQALLDKHNDDPSICLISTDIKNAYNSLSRSQMFAAVESNPLVHDLRRIIHWTHSNTSSLLVYKQSDMGYTRALTISSAEGVQQGHPLGNLCFDLSIHSLYVDVQLQHPDVTLVAVHDDLSIIGPSNKTFAAFQYFSEKLAERKDLELQHRKCRVLIPSNCIQSISSITELAATYGMTVHSGSIALHGGCVGSDEEMMRQHLSKKVDQHKKLLDVISDPRMPSPISFHILRQSIVGSLSFYMRIIPPECALPCLVEFDTLVENALVRSHSLPTLDQQQQMLLPLIGIPRASVTAVAAYFSCVAACLPILPPLIPDGLLYKHFYSTHQVLISEFPVAALSPRIPPSFDAMVSKFCDTDPTKRDSSKLQRFITQKVKSVFIQKLETEQFPQHLITIAQCSSAKHANILFHVPPMHPNFSLSSDDWNQMMRARLGLPGHDHLPSVCPHTVCSLPLDDKNRPHHQHSCLALKPDTTTRHNLILNAFVTFASLCGFVCRKEPRHEQQRRHQLRITKLRPDAVIVSSNPRVPPIMVDVAVTHPSAPTVARLQSPDKRPLAAANATAKAKHKKYDSLAASLGQTFSALVMETYGGMNQEFHQLIDRIIECAQTNQQFSHQQAVNLKVFGYCSIAAALHRGNGLLSRRMFQVQGIDAMQLSSMRAHRRLDFSRIA
jgi:hypothetical protein